jgi:RNA polymerase sigma-70 factor (ECF subfamily)
LPVSDLDLLCRARNGDGGAFHELVDRHGASLFRLAFLLVGNGADAEDVVQETLMGAFRHLNRFRGHSSVKTWLRAILTNQAAMQRRTRVRRKVVALLDEEGDSAALEEVPEAGSAVEQTDARLDVQAVLSALSPEHRQVIVLREYEGMSYQEIAEVLGVPHGTVESRLFRAREHLKQLLKGYG